jgi:hypothetical protein
MMFSEIMESIRQLYQENGRPWLVGFSGDTPWTDARPSERELCRQLIEMALANERANN